MFTRLTKVVGLLGLSGAALLAGCGGGGGSSSQTQLRVMNAVPDETSINVLLDGSSVGSAVAYGAANNYAQTKSGSRHLQVEPTSSTTTFVDQTITLAGGASNTILVANYSSSGSAVVLTDDNTAPTTGNIKLRIVNASPGLGTSDVYVVPPNTNLNNVTPSVTAMGLESSSDYMSLSAGTYYVAFTPQGSKYAYLYAGPFTFTAGQNRTIVAINNQSGGFTTATLNDLN
jgi:Domain of unknown function (DUF4397)